MLHARLKPAAPLDANRIDRLIKELDDKNYNVRESVSVELRQMGDRVEVKLRQALQATASAEQRTRLQSLVTALDRPSSETLRQLRALEVLEKIGDAQAKELVVQYSQGDPDAPITREAHRVLKRMGDR